MVHSTRCIHVIDQLKVADVAVAAVAVFEHETRALRWQFAVRRLPDQMMLSNPRLHAGIVGHLHHHVAVLTAAEDLCAWRRRATPAIEEHPGQPACDRSMFYGLAAAHEALRQLIDRAGRVEQIKQLQIGFAPSTL